MKTIFLICATTVAPMLVSAYEKAFEKTDPGTIEVKVLPEHTVIKAHKDGSYFDENNELFGKLFRYISRNDVAMTVPVKAEIDPGSMYFYIGTKDLSKELKDTESVKVMIIPEARVMSIGIRGGYSEKNFEQAKKKLFDHLEASEDWKVAGAAYAVYWNGPYVPAFLKQFEVHIPVEPKEKVEEKDETALAPARSVRRARLHRGLG